MTETKTACPTCGNEMVSQRTRYRTAGIVLCVLAVALAALGIARLVREGVEGLLSLALAGLLVWLGLRRARANPWFCPNCKTRDFR